MAAGPIAVDHRWATIECDATKNEVTIQVARATIANVGDQNVFISLNNPAGDLFRDGLQHVGEVELEPGDSIPLPASLPKFQHQCLAAQTTKLWYLPSIG